MKDQFVIAYLADLSMTQAVVSHACQLARILKKGLILLYIEDRRRHLPTIASVEKTLLQIEAAHPDIHPAHAALKGNTKEIINALPTLLNGVVAVAGVNPHARPFSTTHPNQVLHLLRIIHVQHHLRLFLIKFLLIIILLFLLHKNI